MEWLLKDDYFDKEKIELNGNKFLIGNGYIGYRGTLDEFTKAQLVACNLSGLYDKVDDKWREPVNAPNGAMTRLFCNGEELSVLTSKVTRHEQCLDIKSALHRRVTEFVTFEGVKVEVKSERFLSLSNIHLMCIKYSFSVSDTCDMVVETGIDADVWDINGPHLKQLAVYSEENNLVIEASTNEKMQEVVAAEKIERDFGEEEIVVKDKRAFRKISVKTIPAKEYSITKYVSIFTGNEYEGDCTSAAILSSATAAKLGYDKQLNVHIKLWKQRWDDCDVVIQGDDYAQFALRYSIYHLMIIAPAHADKASIPARGLSGQVYKGAIFWDTEIFMLPFFLHTNPQIARNLLKYRCNTLEGAKRKAAEYGYRGAFYAWESQDTGDDACTYFNITDVFTGRPMRTYFRDKQIHISADVAYAIWQYCFITGDESLLIEGGAEVIIECARFFYSYSYFNMEKNRYELLDVTGPDEYHERVNNNAFTNSMVKHVFEVALEIIDLLKNKYEKEYYELDYRINLQKDIEKFRDILKRLYIPNPNNSTNIIEQFDGYQRLEEVSLQELKSRMLNPNEYFGGGNGIATTTKIIKQADVVLMLNLFKNKYSEEIKKANWEYYEPITEHGSSLSPCVYALLAADIGKIHWAYKYFIKTATIDLTGESKQYVGNLYIGGTHPASNGGAWMAAILGFAGVSILNDKISISPRLPEKWTSIKFTLISRRQKYKIEINHNLIRIFSDTNNNEASKFTIQGKNYICRAGQLLEIDLLIPNSHKIVWVEL